MSVTDLERPQVRAVAKWVRISPRKARLVVDHIRGRTVPEARTVLAFTSRAAAREVEKVLRSAVANAEANHELIGDTLYVSEAHVDDGLTIKRWQPRARGRVARIKKRTCHITIKLSPVDGVTPARRAPGPETEDVEEVVEAPATESAGALTPEEQKAAAKTRRPREVAPRAEPEAAEPEAETEVAEPQAEAAPETEAAAEPEPEAEENKEKPKRRAPRVRRKKKEEESES
jgi:large subunit ribosomal protein L22